MKNFKGNLFLAEMGKVDWDCVMSEKDVSVTVWHLTDRINSVLDKMAPIKIFQHRQKYTQWLSDDTKKLMKFWDECLKTATQDQTAESWAAYRKQRNICNRAQKHDKSEWGRTRFKSCENERILDSCE